MLLLQEIQFHCWGFSFLAMCTMFSVCPCIIYTLISCLFFFFLTHVVFQVLGLMHSHQFPCFCLGFSVVHFKNGPEYLKRGTSQVFIPFHEISAKKFGFERFSCSSDVLLPYNFFISVCCVCFQYSQVPLIFFLSKFPDVFSAFTVLFLPAFFSLPFFHYQHGTFLTPNFIKN